MGLGTHSGGELKLILSIRETAPSSTRIAEWQQAFQDCSDRLVQATANRSRLGRVYFAIDSAASHEADYNLHPQCPPGEEYCADPTTGMTVITSAPPRLSGREVTGLAGSPYWVCLGEADLAITLEGRESASGYRILHELAHVVFDLGDEYDQGCLGAGGFALSACVMEWAADSCFFCDDDNHLTGPATNNQQHVHHAMSCRESINTLYSTDVPLFATGTTCPSTPPVSSPIVWRQLDGTPRFGLLLDKSSSMNTNNAIDGVRAGGEYWIDQKAAVDAELAVEAYNHGIEEIVFPRQSFAGIGDPAVATAKSDLQAALATGSGLTDIGGALVRGLGDIADDIDDLAGTHVLALFSDGMQTFGTDPLTIVDQLVARHVRLFTIGFGSAVDSQTMLDIADACDGFYRHVPAFGPSPTTAEQDIITQRITDAFTDVNGATSSGTVAHRQSTVGPDEVESIDAFIETGAGYATFTATYRPSRPVDMTIYRPDGSPASPFDPDVSFSRPDSAPYVLYVVEAPESGIWRAEIRPVEQGDPTSASEQHGPTQLLRLLAVLVRRLSRWLYDIIRSLLEQLGPSEPGAQEARSPFTFSAVSSNRHLTVRVSGHNRVHEPGEAITIQSLVTFGVPLQRLTSAVIRPVPTQADPQRIEASDCPLVPMRGVESGRYEGSVVFEEPGGYDLQVELTNEADAVIALGRHGVPDGLDPEALERRAPPFTRIVRMQVHVGELSTGRDIDRD